MSPFTRIAVISASLLAAVLAPVTTYAQALPSATEVIAKYVTAIGGKAALMKVTSIKQTATMEVPAIGLSASMEMYSAAPNKMAVSTNVPGMGIMQSGYNGKVAWDVNPMQGPRLLADKELASSADNADFYGNMLYSPENFASMETVGDTTINGERAYKVKMVRKATMKESSSFFSAKSGLLLAGISSQESQMGTMQVTSTMSDYKAFGSVLMATKLEQQMGPQKIIVSITDVTINGAPDAAFAVPDQVKPLIKP